MFRALLKFLNHSLFVAFKKFIVFATRSDLRIVSFDVNYKVDFTLPITVSQVKAVDYDPVDKMIYWVDDLKEGVIMRSPLNGLCELFFSVFFFVFFFYFKNQQNILGKFSLNLKKFFSTIE